MPAERKGPDGLTDRQRRFVEEYLVDFNATQAAIRAGYSSRTAQEQSSDLLSRPMIADAVARGRAELSRRTGVSAERVIHELAAIGFARLPDMVAWGKQGGMRLVPSDELTDSDARAVQSVTETEKYIKALDGGERLMSRERSIKLHDKTKALTKLGDHLGIWKTEPEPNGEGLKIIIEGE